MMEENGETPINIREILLGNEPVSVKHLYYLTDLSPEDLETFYEIWPEIEPERRRIIIRHLVDITEESYHVDFSDLFAHCLSDPSSEVRKAALDGLWDSERVSLIGSILEICRNDPDDEVKRLAVATLGHYVLLGEWEVIQPKHTRPIIDLLMEILEETDSNQKIWRAALESVASATHARVADHIEDAYDSGDTKLQISAIYAMGQTADTRWLPIILDETQSHLVEMRIEAARAAGAIGSSDAISQLSDLIDDEDLEVKMAAINAIGEIGSDVGRKILMDLLDDPYEEELHPIIEETLEGMGWMDIDFDIDSLDWENSPDDLT